MKKTNALLLKYTPVTDANGNVKKELSVLGNICGIFIPLNSELASKVSGIDENSAFDLFYKGNNPQILLGNVIRYMDKDYYIVHIADYGKIRIIRLSKVIGTKSVKTVVQTLEY